MRLKASMRAALGVLLCVGVASCSQDPGSSRPPGSLGAPAELRFIGAGGGVSVLVPERFAPTWIASYGLLLMCSDVPAEIVEVRPTWTVRPVGFRAWVRTETADRDRLETMPFISALGSAPDFDEEYGDLGKITGTLAPAEGSVISTPCSDPGDAYQDLILELEVDDRGADLGSVAVRFRAASSDDANVASVTLRSYQMTACGTRAPAQLCR